MKKVALEDNTGIELISKDGRLRLYISIVDLFDDRFTRGFHVISDKKMFVSPRSDSSVVLMIDPLNDVQAKRASRAASVIESEDIANR